MIDEIKWTLGDIVHSTICERRGIVTGVLYRQTGYTYLVTWQNCDSEAYCYEFELSSEPVKEWSIDNSDDKI